MSIHPAKKIECPTWTSIQDFIESELLANENSDEYIVAVACNKNGKMAASILASGEEPAPGKVSDKGTSAQLMMTLAETSLYAMAGELGISPKKALHLFTLCFGKYSAGSEFANFNFSED